MLSVVWVKRKRHTVKEGSASVPARARVCGRRRMLFRVTLQCIACRWQNVTRIYLVMGCAPSVLIGVVPHYERERATPTKCS